jgi:AcrR family transcriptional regulator
MLVIIIHERSSLTNMEWTMAPRRYHMGARAEAVARTRSRIVEAAKALHAERGVQATNWEEIAEAAGVSTATVYRHFPSLTELVPACARSVFDLIRPPTVEEARPQFAALATPEERLEHLVRASCHCYRQGEGWLHAAHRERDFVPELDAALRIIEDTLAILIEAAVGRRLREPARSTLFVLCDFPFWKDLVDRGLSARRGEETAVRLVRAELMATATQP